MGISPFGIHVAMGILFTIFLCVVCPIFYLMHRQEMNRDRTKGVIREAPCSNISDEDDDGLENTV